MNTSDTKKDKAVKFGTFLGVYTPSTLTILGLIMYLRFGWVLGNLGLPLTLLVVLMASAITFITGLSASAISTNMHVGVGGEYYMISHSLGLELGGAIGIPLYLCRTLSITFYSFGLAESLAVLWPSAWGMIPPYFIQLATAVIIIVITYLSGKSAEIALKLQIPILITVGLSILALFVGVIVKGTGAPELVATYRSAPEGFWYVFAVFFPAATGFTAGIGMSGDLRDPSRSIPRGTLLAVLTGTLVYLAVPVLLSISKAVSPEQLASSGKNVWITVSLFGPLFVFAGMWGAILSSAFGSVLAGPRVLQALSNDGLAPRFLSRLSREGQPTISTWISGLLALSAVMMGNLNTVAQYVTVLFLTLYVIINISAAIEKLVGDPSYRPTINVPWAVSLLGAAGALFVMFLLNPAACIVASLLELVIFLFLRKKALSKRWGDVRAGMWFSIARFALLKLKGHEVDPRNWRPHIISFTRDITKDIDVVYLANCFNEKHGIVTACKVIEGELDGEAYETVRDKIEMDEVLEAYGLVGFCEAHVASDLETGVTNIVQANGIAGLESNTVMFGWPNEKEKLVTLLGLMRSVAKIRKNTIISKLGMINRRAIKKRIDLWWGGLEYNGDLMLLLAHLLMMNPEWEKSELVVHTIVISPEEKKGMEESISNLIQSVRIQASTEVIVKNPDLSINEIICASSEDSDLVFIGLMIPGAGEEEEYADRLITLADGLPSVVFIRNASEFSGRLI
ncbi:MAG: amino acid permease [Candidatus Krumholzibacteriota bacterium]|nr:amino acid permease [Candidatus Krumholzibacteriota bacterium]